MGCVSSKHIRKQAKHQLSFAANNNNDNGYDFPNHVVSLTSSTYGVLKLDKEPEKEQLVGDEPVKECVVEEPRKEQDGVINAWELMAGLEDVEAAVSVCNHHHHQAKKSPKTRAFLRGFADLDLRRSPLRSSNQIDSPRKMKKSGGNKENKTGLLVGSGSPFDNYTPKRILRTRNLLESPWRLSPKVVSTKKKSTGGEGKCDVVSSRGKSLGPLFDPEIVAFYEKEVAGEEEGEIKKTVWETPTKRRRKPTGESEAILETFERKCPPGGEKSVVIYTTTLRGIRKTFEDCNKVRSVMESHRVQVLERDVSMDSGYREELRALTERKEVRVPVVFVRGRLIGGAEEVVKLEEEGKLGLLLEGLPRGAAGGGGCDLCGGMRFMMCMECNGSCKLFGEEGKNVRCGECNENGLIHCPLCCCLL